MCRVATKRLFTGISPVLFALSACSTALNLQSEKKTVVEPEKEEKTTQQVNTEALKHFMDGEMLLMQGNYPMAVLEFQDALDYDPSSTAIYASLADAYMRIGKFEKAEKNLLEALAIDPKDKDARELLARQYLIRNQPDKAEEQYQYLTALYPEELDYSYMVAEIAERGGNLEKAQSLLWQIYENHPSEERALRGAAEIATRRADYQFALDAYGQLVQLAPSNSHYWQVYSELATELQELPTAIMALERFIQLTGDDTHAPEQLAMRYYETGNMTKADSIFSRLYERGYKSAPVLYFLSRIALDRDEYGSAESYSTELVGQFPEERSGYTNLALACIYQERPLDAISILLKARTKFPDDFAVNYLLGNSYNMEKNYVLAKESLLEALKIFPDDRPAKHLLATVYNNLEEWESSDLLYQELIESDSSDSQALNNYSYTLAERGVDLEGALGMALRALESEPDSPAYLDTVGWIYFKMGKYQEALEYIQKSIGKEDDNAVVLEHMGDVVSVTEGKQKAKDYYRRALELDNDNLRLKQKLAD